MKWVKIVCNIYYLCIIFLSVCELYAYIPWGWHGRGSTPTHFPSTSFKNIYKTMERKGTDLNERAVCECSSFRFWRTRTPKKHQLLRAEWEEEKSGIESNKAHSVHQRSGCMYSTLKMCIGMNIIVWYCSMFHCCCRCYCMKMNFCQSRASDRESKSTQRLTIWWWKGNLTSGERKKTENLHKKQKKSVRCAAK